MGTIGGGNHFAELQRIEQVVDSKRFSELGLDESKLFLMVHSGSRGLGQAVLDNHNNQYGTRGIQVGSPQALHYLEMHDNACHWARKNRALIAERFFRSLGSELHPNSCVVDIWHNSMIQRDFISSQEEGHSDKKKPKETFWVHRKGAASSDEGPIVIPGSRGAMSYLVQPKGNVQYSAFSLAHGAGRKWHRRKALEKGKKSFPDPSSLAVTELNSHVICEDKNLIYEEAPDAYKGIDDVINDLKAHGLIDVICILRPLITYKFRSETKSKSKTKNKQRTVAKEKARNKKQDDDGDSHKNENKLTVTDTSEVSPSEENDMESDKSNSVKESMKKPKKNTNQPMAIANIEDL